MAALQAFHAMLGQDSARAFYGPGHVAAAHELGAIQMLLISDTLFRVNDVAKVGSTHHASLLNVAALRTRDKLTRAASVLMHFPAMAPEYLQ